MRRYILGIKILLCTTLLCLVTGMGVQAGDSIESAGDILTVLLPATAAGLTVGFKDGGGVHRDRKQLSFYTAI